MGNSNRTISRLYNIEPIGVGTVEVESIISYLLRLAAAHSFSIHPYIIMRSDR